MKINFSKYQGAGNDFIIIDNRNDQLKPTMNTLFKELCHRKKGIGADGLILINSAKYHHFEMCYFNSDGQLGSMCGNGGRCSVDFAHHLRLFEESCTFLTCDGTHHAIWHEKEVQISMNDVYQIELQNDFLFLNTGSPHYVSFVKNCNTIDVYKLGRNIRFNDRFSKDGTNVNFAHIEGQTIVLRTYERGVEEETLACGTGAVATAISAYEKGFILSNSIAVKVKGGLLKVTFQKDGQSYTDVQLIGPADFVFKGEYIC